MAPRLHGTLAVTSLVAAAAGRPQPPQPPSPRRRRLPLLPGLVLPRQQRLCPLGLSSPRICSGLRLCISSEHVELRGAQRQATSPSPFPGPAELPRGRSWEPEDGRHSSHSTNILQAPALGQDDSWVPGNRMQRLAPALSWDDSWKRGKQGKEIR